MRRVAAAAVVLMPLVIGCGSAVREGERSWVGGLEGSDSVVGAAIEGERVAVYVCGGPGSMETDTRWFIGDIGAEGVHLERDGWNVDAALTADGDLHGAVTAPAGNARVFALGPVTAGSKAGLYSVVDSGCRTGVVVQQPAAELAVQGVWCSDLGEVDQVTPGIADVEVDDAIAVRVSRPEGVRDLLARRFSPAL